MGPGNWKITGRHFMMGAPIALLSHDDGSTASLARFCYAPSRKYPHGKNLMRAEFRQEPLVRLANAGRCLAVVCDTIRTVGPGWELDERAQAALAAGIPAGATPRASDLVIHSPQFLTNAVSAIIDVEGADALVAMQAFFGREVIAADMFEVVDLLKS